MHLLSVHGSQNYEQTVTHHFGVNDKLCLLSASVIFTFNLENNHYVFGFFKGMFFQDVLVFDNPYKDH